MQQKAPSRRVYMPEFRERTGYSDTWTLVLERRGSVPKFRKDPGGKRKFLFEEEVDAVVRGEYRPKAEAAE